MAQVVLMESYRKTPSAELSPNEVEWMCGANAITSAGSSQKVFRALELLAAVAGLGISEEDDVEGSKSTLGDLLLPDLRSKECRRGAMTLL